MSVTYIFRSAITGRIVTAKFASLNPDTTVKEKKYPRDHKAKKRQIAKRKVVKQKFLDKQPPKNTPGWSFTR